MIDAFRIIAASRRHEPHQGRYIDQELRIDTQSGP